jgi:hypothetical protein
MRKSSDRLRQKEVSSVSCLIGERAQAVVKSSKMSLDYLGLCDVDKEYERHARQQTANARKAKDKKGKRIEEEEKREIVTSVRKQ